MVRGHLKYPRFGLSRNMLGPDIEIQRGVVWGRLRSSGQSKFVARSFEQRLWDEQHVKRGAYEGNGRWWVLGVEERQLQGEILKREGEIIRNLHLDMLKDFFYFLSLQNCINSSRFRIFLRALATRLDISRQLTAFLSKPRQSKPLPIMHNMYY